MKGRINKINDQWGISFKSLRENNEVYEEFLQLHSEDLEDIEKDSQIFDNVESRYENQEVYFEIVGNQKMSGISRYAKIVTRP
jgi:hypothetical protein